MQVQSKRFLIGGSLIVLAFLLYVAGAHVWWGGWAETQVKPLNEVGEPLAIGETWCEKELFSVTVEDVRELSPKARLLEELSADELRPYEEQGCRFLVMTYKSESLDQPEGFDDKDHDDPALPVSIRAAAYDEAGEYIADAEQLPVQGRAPGVKRLIFAPPQTSRFLLTVTIPQTYEQNRSPAGLKRFAPHCTYVYEKNYWYILPEAK